jgi:aminoglycoside phosphotransferase (APT) family kinase protein
MERAHGRVPISEPVYNSAGWLFEASPAQRRTAWESAVDELIRIHQVPADLVRFLPGGGGDGPAFDQVLDDLRAEYAWACAGVEHPVVDRIWDWLLTHRPPTPPDGLSWGDARVGNMMFDADFQLVVVLDWELATLGGSILDLGWWLFFDEVHSSAHPRLDGLGDRDETIARWESGTGLSAEHVEWYEVLAAVRLATIVIRGMTIFGIAPNDQNLFVQLAYRSLGWGEPA